jgi:hypothetical protein
MGTTLTGTTPQDTYDSLIKVTDNGPLSGTAKYLSDGLGNDSALALSTGAAGVGTTTLTRKFNIDGGSITSDTPTLRISSTDGSGTRKFGIEFFSNNGADVRGKLLADNNGKVYLDDSGGGGVILAGNGGSNVGIGTTAPSAKLHVADSAAVGVNVASSASQAFMNFTSVNTAGFEPFIGFGGTTAGDQAQMIGVVNGGVRWTVAGTERMRLTTNGLTFNGDTAAANALDDYEEGTWTATFVGATTAGTYTPTDVNATYTKIGRVVTLQYKATFASAASGGAGYMEIGGLPFAYAANSGGLTGTVILSDASWGGSYLSMLPVSSGSGTRLLIVETAPSTALVNLVQAGDFNTSTDIRFTLTYQV